jgi:hypothetical protein
MKKKITATIILTGWLFLVTIIMMLIVSFSLEIFFICWLIGIVVIAELIDTKSVHVGYVKYVYLQIAVGIVVLGVIAIQKVLEIFAS